LDAYGERVYTEAVDPRATKGKQQKSSRDNSVKGGGNDGVNMGDLALSKGTDVKGALGNINIKGQIPMQNNQKIGYASAPKMKAYASGSGTERIVTGGVVAQMYGNTVKYFAVEYKASPDLLTKIQQGDEDAIALMQKTDATLTEIKGGYSRIPSGDLKVMKTGALKQATLVDLSVDGNTEESEAATSSEGGSMSNF
jgi:hypothetical protein